MQALIHMRCPCSLVVLFHSPPETIMIKFSNLITMSGKNNVLYDGNDLSAFVLIYLLSLHITLCTVT